MVLTIVTAKMLSPILIACAVAIAPFILFEIIRIGIEKMRFNTSSYSYISGNGFFKTYFDKGLYGEYRIVRQLEKIEEYQKIIVNPYIPKGVDDTTEIDIIYINAYGIFVIESKNYSGWIYGSEKNKNWTQTLGKNKNSFYNPVLQNKEHIKQLANYLKFSDKNMHSIIVFSDKCELKKIEVSEATAKIIKRKNIAKTIQSYRIGSLSQNDIDYAYAMIDSKARASTQTKEKHIERIKARR